VVFQQYTRGVLILETVLQLETVLVFFDPLVGCAYIRDVLQLEMCFY